MKNNNTNAKLRYLLVCFLLLPALITETVAQVTIGTRKETAEGALLELTEGDVTTKGLLLPRVKLTDLKSLDDINPGQTPRPDETLHIGLTVYNVPNDELCPTIGTGVYVWLGTKWERQGDYTPDFLSPLLRNQPPQITIERDQDGNYFAAASFGTIGTWMLHNLAVTKYADGTPIAVYDGTADRTAAAYSYPNATPGNWGTPPYTYKRDQGLLYTWAAATRGYAPGNINQSQSDTSGIPGADEVENEGTDGTAPNKYVQGVCPDGWHLPSDREWNLLEKEAYTSPLSYSSYTSGDVPFSPSWNANWEVDPAGGYRGVAAGNKGQGAVLKDPCLLNYFMDLNPTNGKSLSIADSGFNAKLTGIISADNVFNYGIFGYFWTSSAYNADRAWFRYVFFDSPAVGRNSEDKGDLLSVRCKKN